MQGKASHRLQRRHGLGFKFNPFIVYISSRAPRGQVSLFAFEQPVGPSGISSKDPNITSRGSWISLLMVLNVIILTDPKAAPREYCSADT